MADGTLKIQRATRAGGKTSGTDGFTLVELLVVIAIIVILAGILIPAAISVRACAGAAKCQTNLAGLGKAFLIFAADHNDYLPGNYYTRNEAEYWKTDWLSGQGVLPDTGADPDPATIDAAFAATPQHGTIFPYIGKQSMVLRCPVLPAGVYGKGEASNGKFDYSAVGIFAGAKTDRIYPISQFINPKDNSSEPRPTPLIVEEDPDHHINSKYIEGCHGHIDKLSRTHNHGSSYAAPDGSLHFLAPPPDAAFWHWEILTPSGVWWTQYMDFQRKKYGLAWGEWNGK
jgi:prepilin-type N-terminal cleavage/methylation domain-containing protein